MALEEFEKEREGRNKGYRRMKSIMDYGMGVLWMAMGIFLLFPTKFSPQFEQYDNAMMKSFAGVCILYGIFRLYRGYKKNY
jgi:hypothetical protein